MREFRFEPPLNLTGQTLRGPTVVRSLDDAAEVARTYPNARRPVLQDGVLRQLEYAGTTPEQYSAAAAFRAWIRVEGLLAR